MPGFNEAINGMDVALFDDFGEDATKNASLACRVVVEQDVNRFNDFGEAVFNSFEISTLNAQSELQEGDEFALEGGRVFKITNIINGDESITTGVAVLD